MKMLYQQLIGFFSVIMVTLVIVSILFIRSTTNTVWENGFKQLEQYTDVLKITRLTKIRMSSMRGLFRMPKKF